jgi:photosystem II stability/assembly factor-like uncharacterized protein
MNVSIQNSRRYFILAGFAVYSLLLLFLIGAAFPGQAKQISIVSQTPADEYTVYDRKAPVTVTGSFTFYFPLVVNNYTAPAWTFVGLPGLPIRQVVSSNNGTLYAVIESALILTPTNTIFRSIDDGMSWQSASNDLSGRVRSLFVHPLSPTLLLAGTLTGGAGVHASFDSGDTWESRGLDALVRVVTASPLSTTLWLAAYFDPLNPWFATMMRTDNAGLTWQQVYSNGVVINTLQFDPPNPARAHACSNAGYLRSKDAGLTWEHATLSSCEDFVIVPYSATIMYVAEGTHVLRTENDAITWTTVLTAESLINTLALYPAIPPQIYAGAGNTLFRSVDGGATWQAFRPNYTAGFSYIYDLVVSGPGIVYVGTDQGVWKVSFK